MSEEVQQLLLEARVHAKYHGFVVEHYSRLDRYTRIVTAVLAIIATGAVILALTMVAASLLFIVFALTLVYTAAPWNERVVQHMSARREAGRMREAVERALRSSDVARKCDRMDEAYMARSAMSDVPAKTYPRLLQRAKTEVQQEMGLD